MHAQRRTRALCLVSCHRASLGHSRVSVPQAEYKLAKEMPGTFLIRNASDGGQCISIRLPQNKMLNVKVSWQLR